MKTFFNLTFAILLVFVVGCSEALVNPEVSTPEEGQEVYAKSEVFESSALASKGGGFDALGYNRTARIFNAAVDGADGTLDGTYWGNTTYANDKLKMKWNEEWDRGNAEGWSDPDGYRAWIDNQWNGNVPGGSGEVWHYRIKWIGACGSAGTPTGDGGYCIWGQFEVVMSHGSVDGEHFWETHATPSGFGN